MSLAWIGREKRFGWTDIGYVERGIYKMTRIWLFFFCIFFKGLIDQAYDRVVKLLTTEWLVSDVDLVVEGYCLFFTVIIGFLVYWFLFSARRKLKAIWTHKDSTNIRSRTHFTTSRYVVHVKAEYVVYSLCFKFFYLTSLLFFFNLFLYRNLNWALQLVNIVADSRYKLYDDFKGVGGRNLSDYLGAVRQVILGVLENGGSDPFSFYPLIIYIYNHVPWRFSIQHSWTLEEEMSCKYMSLRHIYEYIKLCPS